MWSVAGCNCGTPSGIQVRNFGAVALDLRILNTLDAIGLDETHAGMAIALIPQPTTGTMSAKVYNNLVSSRSQGIVLYEGPSMTVTGNANNLWNTPGGNVLGSYDPGTMYSQDPLYVDAATSSSRRPRRSRTPARRASPRSRSRAAMRRACSGSWRARWTSAPSSATP